MAVLSAFQGDRDSRDFMNGCHGVIGSCCLRCKCYGDLWVFDVASSTWSPINASNAPIHRYRQSLVRDDRDGSLYLFGGESYRPYMYHNAINKLVLSGAQHSDVRHSSKASSQSSSTTRQSLEASNGAGTHRALDWLTHAAQLV